MAFALELSQEESRVLELPIFRYLRQETIEEATGKISENQKSRNKLLRELFTRITKNGTHIPLNEEIALEMGLIEFVSEKTIKEILNGTFDIGLEDLVALSKIVRYFRDQKTESLKKEGRKIG